MTVNLEFHRDLSYSVIIMVIYMKLFCKKEKMDREAEEKIRRK